MELKLKELRIIKGLSQQEVADYLHCSADRIRDTRRETEVRRLTFLLK